jgi:hypothetical protein
MHTNTEPQVRMKPTITVFEQLKTVYALESFAQVIGSLNFMLAFI